ncbi:hypothetical protein SAMN05421863_104035 [Nitrosomonas communis]|uniref:Uncharacterized protein n=1 Tax=Nitrosomonas communis TaxID=44574 RepID=A0A1I4SH38_9PROT|nr:hypothetical protein SAMN05421863_104035 [Nitrosomonas communis]
MIIHIARRDFDSRQFSLVIDDQVQLEPIKPIHTGLSSSSKLCHYFMRPNAAIAAHADLGRINEADPTALPKAAGQKTAQGHQATLQQLHKAVVASSLWKITPLLPQHVI